ncbi:hypothetical protein CCHR01_06936 [Colletotrichum chrysophilum]|uniref:Uncharacterized protein n=1 Tax=Colletotrichum chrysophilum TaxID=1836956 RepID=A0AAD9EJB9_9PEZI|nr:hypothetical protein CCHR01_06936 [Colletotrichum chrysophilum]
MLQGHFFPLQNFSIASLRGALTFVPATAEPVVVSSVAIVVIEKRWRRHRQSLGITPDRLASGTSCSPRGRSFQWTGKLLRPSATTTSLLTSQCLVFYTVTADSRPKGHPCVNSSAYLAWNLGGNGTLACHPPTPSSSPHSFPSWADVQQCLPDGGSALHL